MTSYSNVRPVLSTYCFEEAPTSIGQLRRVPSDYALNTGLNQSELERERQKMEGIRRQPSIYVSNILNDPNEAEKIPQREVVGLALHGAAIRGLVANLDNVIYTPKFYDGRLFFVNEDAVLHTARRVGSFDQPEDGVATCRKIESLDDARLNAAGRFNTMDGATTSQKYGSENLNNKPDGLMVSMETLERVLPHDTMKALCKELMDQVHNGRLVLNAHEISTLTRLSEGDGPSESVNTARRLNTEGLYTCPSPGSSRTNIGTHDAITERDVDTAIWNSDRSASVRTARGTFSPNTKASTRSSRVATAYRRNEDLASVKTGRQLSLSPSPQTGRNVNSTIERTARQQSLSPLPRTARNVDSVIERTARQQSRSPSPWTARHLNSVIEKTARQQSLSPSPRTARNVDSVIERTARQQSLSPLPRTARNVNSVVERTARQQSLSPSPHTARNVNSLVERTARQRSLSPYPRTARNVNSLVERTARQQSLSPSPHTARNVNSLVERTSRQRSLSPSPRTARNVNSLVERTARQRSLSPSPRTARNVNSLVERTARQQSLSPTPRTAIDSACNVEAPASRSVYLMDSNLARTPTNANSTTTANLSNTPASLNCQTPQANAEEMAQVVEDPPQPLGSSDLRAAAATLSDCRTAEPANN